MFKKKIVLLSGKQGSGKSTLAKLLKEAVGASVLRFAGPIYEMHEACRAVAARYGIPFADKERTLLQVIGTEWGRHTKGEDVWVKAALAAAAEEIAKGAPLVVFDDCRFPNELAAFGGRSLNVRLEAPTDVRAGRAVGWCGTEHLSEAALDGCVDFHLTLCTATQSPSACVECILQALGGREGGE